MKVKYVGLKVNGSTAFKAQTGITWFPGDSHEVKDSIAVNMLKHSDVFAMDAVKIAESPVIDTAGLTLAPGGKVEIPAPASITLPSGQVIVLNGLNKDTLHQIAKESGVSVHHMSGAAKVVEALVAAFPTQAE